MLKFFLSFTIILASCGKKIEKNPSVSPSRSPDNTSIEAEIDFKAGVNKAGEIFFTEYSNKIDDLCLEIPKTIKELSGAFEENSELKLEINTDDHNGSDYVACHYKLTTQDYSIDDCFDYQNRSLGIRNFWFSYLNKSITFSFQNVSTKTERRAQTKIQLKACGS